MHPRISHLRPAFVAAVAAIWSCGSEPVATVPGVGRVALNAYDLTLTGIGITVQLSATVIDERGNIVTGIAVTWSSDNPAVATVSGEGSNATVWSVGDGSTIVRATAGGVTGTATVTVRARVNSVSVSPTTLDMRRNESVALTVTVDADPGVPTTVTWESSVPNVVAITSNGEVTAIGLGLTVVTARSTADARKAAFVTTIVRGVTSVAVSPNPVTMMCGSTLQMQAEVLVWWPTTSKAVTWRSTNSAIVSVDSLGVVAAADSGRAYVVAAAVYEPVIRDSSLVTVTGTCPLAP